MLLSYIFHKQKESKLELPKVFREVEECLNLNSYRSGSQMTNPMSFYFLGPSPFWLDMQCGLDLCGSFWTIQIATADRSSGSSWGCNLQSIKSLSLGDWRIVGDLCLSLWIRWLSQLIPIIPNLATMCTSNLCHLLEPFCYTNHNSRFNPNSCLFQHYNFGEWFSE